MNDGASSALVAAIRPWLAHHVDAEIDLVWNPPGSLDDEGVPARLIHQVPQSAWWALDRAAMGDESGVDRTVRALLALQYDEPDTPWHGTFARFAESPPPTSGAVEFHDFDPNWRQFVGIAFALLLRHHRRLLADDLAQAMEDAIQRAVIGETESGRLRADYTNIATQHAWLLDAAGRGDEAAALADRIATDWRRHRTFPEYNSPTYDGVSAWALALWRGSSDTLGPVGAEIEADLWRTIADRWHPGLGNMVGPYGRAYGLDAHRYVAKLALLLRAAGVDAPVPLPTHADEPAVHGHDLYAVAAMALAPPTIPADAAERLATFGGETTVSGTITDAPTRRHHHAWLGHDVMIGAEAGESDWTGWFQFVAGTVHWRLPDGGVGVIRYVPDGRPQGHVAPGALTTEPGARFLVDLPDPSIVHFTRRSAGDLGIAVLADGRTVLPGLTVDNRRRGATRTLEVRTP